MPPDTEATLGITITDDGLILVGDIDAHTAPVLAEALAGCRQPIVQLDVSAVDFVDSMGFRELVHANNVARADGRSLRLVDPSYPVVRLLAIVGVDEYLNA